ncbi:fatty-acid amide hydrolase 1-like [Rhinoderma darwinii]|uniref:fatty-acid amide hydrolase 1-like n=1 Tax=Rhinoderma darwinii TaxID=43563 RepID=UPI003F678E71
MRLQNFDVVSPHSHMETSSCVLDPCLTVGPSDTSSYGQMTGLLLLLVLFRIHGILTIVQVLGPQVFWEALEVNDNLNCVTIFLSDCQTQLEGLREHRVRGPLYGVPVSIKEHVGYQGHPSTCGLVQYLDVLEKEDSVIIRVLKKQGAIVFTKTNVPQSLFCYETSNPIYGLTLNPHNKAKAAAGSSGGEGALIGSGGSILGIGSDLGGSVRLPASFCGIAGFKPTPNRLRSSSHRSVTATISSYGARRVNDELRYWTPPITADGFSRNKDGVTWAVVSQLPVFPKPPLPCVLQTFSSVTPLRIGYYQEDGFFQPNPSMRRVLLETKQLLEEAGHQLIPFNPPRVDNMLAISFKLMLGDGGRILADKFENNVVDPNLEDCLLLLRMPSAVKRLLALILRPVFPRISRTINSACGARSVKDHWAHHIELEDYRTEFISEWRQLSLDVVLCPMLGPAFNTGYAGRLLAAISYTMLYSLLNFPAGVVPVGSVTAEDEEELKHYRGYSNDPWDKLFKKAVEGGVGLPLSVQCAALPYQDELCLRLMKEIETLSSRHHKG